MEVLRDKSLGSMELVSSNYKQFKQQLIHWCGNLHKLSHHKQKVLATKPYEIN